MTHSPRVVFLANDAVFQQGLAFLESFRTHNPDLHLSMIPFADDIENFRLVQKVYEFDILPYETARWDELGKEFFPGAQKKYLHRLRKLAIFDARAPATIYLDLDMVVLKNLAFLAEPIVSGEADFICTATANDPWVYNDTYKTHPQLQKAKRFSDGFFAFNPLMIDADKAYTTLSENKQLYLSVRAKDVYCQPATNFIIDVIGLNTAEVYRLFRHISPQVWYAGKRLSLIDDKVVSDDGKEVLFVHWAGPVDMNDDFRFKKLFESYFETAMERAIQAGVARAILTQKML